MCVMGSWLSSRSGHSPCHMRRATWPWSSETALARLERRSARTGIEKVSPQACRLRPWSRKESRSSPRPAGPAPPADAEHDFLRETLLQLTGIQARGQFAVGLAVTLDITVEQIERDAAQAHLPQAGRTVAPRP